MPEIPLPKRNATTYVNSHYYLDDLPQSTEPLDENPRPHTQPGALAEEQFVSADEGCEAGGVAAAALAPELAIPAAVGLAVGAGATLPSQATQTDLPYPAAEAPRPDIRTLNDTQQAPAPEHGEAAEAGGAAHGLEHDRTKHRRGAAAAAGARRSSSAKPLDERKDGNR